MMQLIPKEISRSANGLVISGHGFLSIYVNHNVNSMLNVLHPGVLSYYRIPPEVVLMPPIEAFLAIFAGSHSS